MSTGDFKINPVDVAEPFRSEVRSLVRSLQSRGVAAPLLVGILANNDPAAAKYAEWTGAAFLADGLRYEVRRVDDETKVEAVLAAANADPNVHGIIVYYPIFGMRPSYSGSSADDYLRDSVSPTKDVEGLSHLYRKCLYRNVRYVDDDAKEVPFTTGGGVLSSPQSAALNKCILPCTALSVVKILEHCKLYDCTRPVGSRLSGRVCTVINRSEIVGRPLAAMLANDGASVYSVDVDSVYLFRGGAVTKVDRPKGAAPAEGDGFMSVEDCVKSSDAVISGVPVKGYKVPPAWIKEGCVFVNVASFKNVDEDELLKVKGVKYCGMVGKVTVAMLERNLIRLYDQYHRPKVDPKKEELRASVKSIRDLQLVTAVGVAALLAIQLFAKLHCHGSKCSKK